MKDFKVIEVKRSVFEDNDADAAKLRAELKREGTFLLNLMSSPGAGKTTTLKRTISMLKDELRIGIMEADIDSDVDAQAIIETGVRAIQIHTGGMCHLDADMMCCKYHQYSSSRTSPFFTPAALPSSKSMWITQTSLTVFSRTTTLWKVTERTPAEVTETG